MCWFVLEFAFALLLSLQGQNFCQLITCWSWINQLKSCFTQEISAYLWLSRRWIKSGLTVDFEIFKNARNEFNVALYNVSVVSTTVRSLTVATISKPCFPSMVIYFITRNQRSSLITTVQQPKFINLLTISSCSCPRSHTKSPCPSSNLDPMPSWIFKQQINTLCLQSLCSCIP